MIQIEGPSAVDQAAGIAAIDGVDVLFVGPTDLSHALGVPGDVTVKSYLEAVERVGKAAAEHRKAAGVLLWNLDQLDQYRDLGYTVMALGSTAAISPPVHAAATGLGGAVELSSMLGDHQQSEEAHPEVVIHGIHRTSRRNGVLPTVAPAGRQPGAQLKECDTAPRTVSQTPMAP
jgi:hypothetical protein